MRYFKMIQYAEGDNYETKETIITEPIFQQYRQMIAEGKEKLVLQDRIISVSSIKEIVPADDIVAGYQKQGLKIEGLLETPEVPKIAGEIMKPKKIGDYLRETKEAFFKKMGWKP